MCKWLLNFIVRPFTLLPGAPAFRASSLKDFKKTLWEFFCTLIFSLLPLFVIHLLQVLSSDSSMFSFGIISKYIDAGQIFFYVGPILGGIVYLLIFDVKMPDRLWFIVYIILCLVTSVTVLVLHHLSQIIVNGNVITVSIIVYVVSLYFSFVYMLYGNLSNDYGSVMDERQSAVDNGLQGFTGE